jgi:hypothetical protein
LQIIKLTYYLPLPNHTPLLCVWGLPGGDDKTLTPTIVQRDFYRIICKIVPKKHREQGTGNREQGTGKRFFHGKVCETCFIGTAFCLSRQIF